MTVSSDRSDSIPFGYRDFGDLVRENSGSIRRDLEFISDSLGSLLWWSKEDARAWSLLALAWLLGFADVLLVCRGAGRCVGTEAGSRRSRGSPTVSGSDGVAAKFACDSGTITDALFSEPCATDHESKFQIDSDRSATAGAWSSSASGPG